MKTLRLIADARNLDSDESRATILRAAEILRSGGTVAFPTETVYGLGANALDASAVAKIFTAKQRPGWDPLIVHLADQSMLDAVVSHIPERAERLINAFWPGPLTLLLSRNHTVPDAVTAGRALVGVRVPQHPVAHALLLAAGIPVAAPSANRFGHISPTQAAHVLEDLDGRIDAVLDAGESAHGLESTVVEAGEEDCIVYRPGILSLEQIQAICPEARPFQESSISLDAPPESLPAPGVGLRHYAPKARLVLVDGEEQRQREQFAHTIVEMGKRGERLGLMLPDGFTDFSGDALVFRWGTWANKAELAHRLFAGLRWLDAAGATVILCPLPEAKGIGVAIRDRLNKAARTS